MLRTGGESSEMGVESFKTRTVLLLPGLAFSSVEMAGYIMAFFHFHKGGLLYSTPFVRIRASSVESTSRRRIYRARYFAPYDIVSLIVWIRDRNGGDEGLSVWVQGRVNQLR